MDIGREENVQLHKEVVTGIVQMITFVVENLDKGLHVSLQDVCNVGYKEKSDSATMFICEYAKDGIINLRIEDARKIIAGDHSGIWSATNYYLKGFGYDSVEPVSLDL